MTRRRAAVLVALVVGLAVVVRWRVRDRRRPVAVHDEWRPGPPVAPAAASSVAPVGPSDAAVGRRGEERVDDLKLIRGIGPALEQRLHAHGVTSFRQLADLDPAGIAELEACLGGFAGRIRRDDWIAQAAELDRRTGGRATG